MPMISEPESLQAKAGHFGNGHLTSRGITALHRLYIHTHTREPGTTRTDRGRLKEHFPKLTHDVQFTRRNFCSKVLFLYHYLLLIYTLHLLLFCFRQFNQLIPVIHVLYYKFEVPLSTSTSQS